MVLCCDAFGACRGEKSACGVFDLGCRVAQLRNLPRGMLRCTPARALRLMSIVVYGFELRGLKPIYCGRKRLGLLEGKYVP